MVSAEVVNKGLGRCLQFGRFVRCRIFHTADLVLSRESPVGWDLGGRGARASAEPAHPGRPPLVLPRGGGSAAVRSGARTQRGKIALESE